MNTPKLFNETFNAGADHTRGFNACVGNNGLVDSRSYGDGFAEAVDILTSSLLSHDDRGQLDTLIYPICFCARHHVELFLKEQIEAISSMRAIPLTVPISATHDLGNLWHALVDVSRKTDQRFQQPIAELEGMILDIAQIDPTGQTFRYPTDIESAKHLVQTPVINVPTLRDRFMDLARMIRDFEYLSDAIGDEYRRGTFTSKLSRHQLEIIAKFLPARSDWRDKPEFIEAKIQLMKEHALSGKDFIKAVDTIQGHQEFCSHIGLCKPVPDLSTASLDNLNKLFAGTMRAEEIPPEELIALSAVFEIAAPSLYSEDYDRVRKSFALDFDVDECSFTLIPRWARQLKRLSAGLRKMGQVELANHLEQHVDPTPLNKKRDAANEAFAKRFPRNILRPNDALNKNADEAGDG